MAHMSACSGPGGADFTGECTFGQKRPLTFELQHKGVNIFSTWNGNIAVRYSQNANLNT